MLTGQISSASSTVGRGNRSVVTSSGGTAVGPETNEELQIYDDGTDTPVSTYRMIAWKVKMGARRRRHGRRGGRVGDGGDRCG